MRIDAGIPASLETAGERAQRAEARGYDAVWTGETAHDPLMPLVVAAGRTTAIGLGTSITVAFARSPMTLASTAWDLNAYARGRFMLGLGSQIKPHIEKRFSMPWSHPAARMREFISAMRAIWDSWQHGTKLDFRGDFYTHTIMTPMFNPGPSEFGPPRVLLAAVGEGMTRVAGEVADGLLVHGFTTEKYLRSVTIPALQTALAASGRTRSDFELTYPAFVVTGDTEEEIAVAAAGTRKQIAFYGSTPAYRPVLALHGWGDLQPELNMLSKQGKWDEMASLIDDEVLNTFAVVGTAAEVPTLLHARYGDIIDRLRLYLPYDDGTGCETRILAALKALG